MATALLVLRKGLSLGLSEKKMKFLKADIDICQPNNYPKPQRYFSASVYDKIYFLLLQIINNTVIGAFEL